MNMKTKNSRKFLSLIMTLAMIMTLLDGMTISASAYNGAGTETSPYLIASAADFQQLATDVNGGNDFNGEYFQLTTNLDLSTVPPWTPIGGAGSGDTFAGTFDGDGYTISGLSITSVADHVGLFGDASADSVIMDLTVSGAAVSGGKNVGAVVGRTYGEVNGCAVSNNSFVESNGMGQGVGAVVGSAWGSSSKVIDCTATSSTVEGIAATTYVGGVVGKAEGAVQNCKNINTQVDSRLYAGGNLTLITDFSAPALGPGQTAMGTPANIGDLYITGGSVKTMITQNAYSSWGLTTGGAGEVVTTIGSTTYKYYINEAAIKATKLTGPSSSPVYLCVIPVDNSGSYEVYKGTTLLYDGGLHDYFYTDSTTTIDNFSTIPTIQTDYNLYLYLTQETHFLTVDNQLVIVTV